MKIAGASLQLEANSSHLQRHEVRESLISSARNTGPTRAPDRLVNRDHTADSHVRISDSAKQTQLNESAAIDKSFNSTNNDPTLRLIRAMVEILTGRAVEIFDASTLNHPGGIPTEVRAPAPIFLDTNLG